MDFISETATAPQGALSRILAGDPFHVYDYTVPASQTLEAGEVVAFDAGTGRVTALATGPATEETFDGTGAATTFTLSQDDVQESTVHVTVGGEPVTDYTISHGTGTAGADQIVFGTAPASGTDNIVVTYSRTTAVAFGVILEPATTGAGETAIKPVLVSGPVVLDELVNAPADWKRGMVVGQLILR